MLFTIVSCKTKERLVTVVEHTTDTLWSDRWHRDSIYLKDSVFVNQYVKGDTVFRELVRWKVEYRDRWLMDSVRIVSRDSIPVPYPVTEYVEKQLTWWQQTRLHAGEVALIALAILAGVGVWRLIRRVSP